MMDRLLAFPATSQLLDLVSKHKYEIKERKTYNMEEDLRKVREAASELRGKISSADLPLPLAEGLEEFAKYVNKGDLRYARKIWLENKKALKVELDNWKIRRDAPGKRNDPALEKEYSNLMALDTYYLHSQPKEVWSYIPPIELSRRQCQEFLDLLR